MYRGNTLRAIRSCSVYKIGEKKKVESESRTTDGETQSRVGVVAVGLLGKQKVPFLQRLYRRLPLWIAFSSLFFLVLFFFPLPLVFKQTENSQNRCVFCQKEKKKKIIILEKHPSDLHHLVRQVFVCCLCKQKKKKRKIVPSFTIPSVCYRNCLGSAFFFFNIK